MDQPDPRPKDTPWLIPALTVKSIPASQAFYEKAFGFEPGMALDDDEGQPGYGDMRYKGQLVIMLMREGAYGGDAKAPASNHVEPAVGLYVYCDEVDALFAQAEAAGAAVLSVPADMFWGDRVARLRDPDGHSWSFATKMREFTTKATP